MLRECVDVIVHDNTSQKEIQKYIKLFEKLKKRPLKRLEVLHKSDKLMAFVCEFDDRPLKKLVYFLKRKIIYKTIK